MATHRPRINPALLVWGRQTLRLTDEQAAARLDVSVDTLREWEAGMLAPTIAQLRNAAEKYRRPLGVFFLSAPPEDPTPPHDFRTLPGKDVRELTPELLVELRRAHHRREVALELLQDLERRPTRLQLRVQLDEDPEIAARRVRHALGVQRAEQHRWGEDGAFTGWKTVIEAHGVLVFQSRGVSYEEVRGFSIAEHPLPVIVVNGSDFPNARTFTLLHEFVHLLLELGGICDPYAHVRRGPSKNSRIEVFCNHVAGAILVPASLLQNHSSVVANEDPEEWTDAGLERIGRDFGVSTLVVVRRLLTLGRTTERFYQQYHQRMAARAAKHRRERVQDSGPPRAVMVVADLGRTFTGAVLDAYGARVITASDVSDYLRIRVPQIGAVQARLSLSAGE
jgi:Zn-dependent peptidase ImmA (M78 family)